MELETGWTTGAAALTVDVEDWYQTSDFDFPRDTWTRFDDRVVPNTHRLLDLFDEFGARGTFFVLGCVAQAHGNLVREIAARGHEVACHGGWHQMLTRMSPDEIREDLTWSKGLLEDLSGQQVTAFRAPSWSIGRYNLSVLKVIEDVGFEIDSSLQPFRTPLSGMRGVPHHPFHPVVDGDSLRLLEFPSCVWRVAGMPVPFSGGLYLRLWPGPVVRHLLRRVNRARRGMVYVHPWEVDPGQPRITASPLLLLTHYAGLHTTLPKLRTLLHAFNFEPLSEVVADQTFPPVTLRV